MCCHYIIYSINMHECITHDLKRKTEWVAYICYHIDVNRQWWVGYMYYCGVLSQFLRMFIAVSCFCELFVRAYWAIQLSGSYGAECILDHQEFILTNWTLVYGYTVLIRYQCFSDDDIIQEVWPKQGGDVTHPHCWGNWPIGIVNKDMHFVIGHKKAPL